MDTAGRVFITGSTGFIGSQLVALLCEQGYTVRGLARTVPDPRMPDSKASKSVNNVEYIRGDITDIESIRRGMQGCRCVFHVAGYAKNWARAPGIYDAVNIQGTRNVFAVAKDIGVERIVWTSTVVTLGPTRPGEIGDRR